MEQITTTSEGPYIRQENRSSETKPTARSQQLYCQHTNHLWNTEECHTAVAMGWQHTEPGTSSHPVAPVPVCGWHRQEGHRDRKDTGTGGTQGQEGQEGQQSQEQGRESALAGLTADVSLLCGFQSLLRDLNTAFNHSKVTTLSLARAWRAIILTVCSL